MGYILKIKQMKVLFKNLILSLLLGIIMISCEEDDFDGQDFNIGDISALPQMVTDPIDNPTSEAKVVLGRTLFWDPILSGEKDVACATCHHPNEGYADGLDLSIGVGGQNIGPNRRVGHTGFVRRNAQTILNTAFNGIKNDAIAIPELAPMFWDNRAKSLEEQALLPLLSFEEMRGNAYSEAAALDSITARLQNIAAYRSMFEAAFGTTTITAENMAKAIATFERTLLANNSPFDRYMRGDENAMTAEQIEGMNEFIEVGCVACHSGAMFSDYELHVLGVRDNNKLNESDDGDGNYAFRTPTLRNLAYTAPYMHNGEFNTLNRVLDFYDDNNDDAQNGNVRDNDLDINLRRLEGINRRSRDEIIAFLNALNDDNFDRTIPTNVPSGLQPGGH